MADLQNIYYRLKLDSSGNAEDILKINDALEKTNLLIKQLMDAGVSNDDKQLQHLLREKRTISDVIKQSAQNYKDVASVVNNLSGEATKGLEATLKHLEKLSKDISLATADDVKRLEEMRHQYQVISEETDRRNLKQRSFATDFLNLQKMTNEQLRIGAKQTAEMLDKLPKGGAEMKQMLSYAMGYRNQMERLNGSMSLGQAWSFGSSGSADKSVAEYKQALDTITSYQKDFGKYMSESMGSNFDKRVQQIKQYMSKAVTDMANSSEFHNLADMEEARKIAKDLKQTADESTRTSLNSAIALLDAKIKEANQVLSSAADGSSAATAEKLIERSKKGLADTVAEQKRLREEQEKASNARIAAAQAEENHEAVILKAKEERIAKEQEAARVLTKQRDAAEQERQLAEENIKSHETVLELRDKENAAITKYNTEAENASKRREEHEEQVEIHKRNQQAIEAKMVDTQRKLDEIELSTTEGRAKVEARRVQVQETLNDLNAKTQQFNVAAAEAEQEKVAAIERQNEALTHQNSIQIEIRKNNERIEELRKPIQAADPNQMAKASALTAPDEALRLALGRKSRSYKVNETLKDVTAMLATGLGDAGDDVAKRFSDAFSKRLRSSMYKEMPATAEGMREAMSKAASAVAEQMKLSEEQVTGIQNALKMMTKETVADILSVMRSSTSTISYVMRELRGLTEQELKDLENYDKLAESTDKKVQARLKKLNQSLIDKAYQGIARMASESGLPSEGLSSIRKQMNDNEANYAGMLRGIARTMAEDKDMRDLFHESVTKVMKGAFEEKTEEDKKLAGSFFASFRQKVIGALKEGVPEMSEEMKPLLSRLMNEVINGMSLTPEQAGRIIHSFEDNVQNSALKGLRTRARNLVRVSEGPFNPDGNSEVAPWEKLEGSFLKSFLRYEESPAEQSLQGRRVEAKVRTGEMLTGAGRGQGLAGVLGESGGTIRYAVDAMQQALGELGRIQKTLRGTDVGKISDIRKMIEDFMTSITVDLQKQIAANKGFLPEKVEQMYTKFINDFVESVNVQIHEAHEKSGVYDNGLTNQIKSMRNTILNAAGSSISKSARVLLNDDKFVEEAIKKLKVDRPDTIEKFVKSFDRYVAEYLEPLQKAGRISAEDITNVRGRLSGSEMSVNKAFQMLDPEYKAKKNQKTLLNVDTLSMMTTNISEEMQRKMQEWKEMLAGSFNSNPLQAMVDTLGNGGDSNHLITAWSKAIKEQKASGIIDQEQIKNLEMMRDLTEDISKKISADGGKTDRYTIIREHLEEVLKKHEEERVALDEEKKKVEEAMKNDDYADSGFYSDETQELINAYNEKAAAFNRTDELYQKMGASVEELRSKETAAAKAEEERAKKQQANAAEADRLVEKNKQLTEQYEKEGAAAKAISATIEEATNKEASFRAQAESMNGAIKENNKTLEELETTIRNASDKSRFAYEEQILASLRKEEDATNKKIKDLNDKKEEAQKALERIQKLETQETLSSEDLALVKQKADFEKTLNDYASKRNELLEKQVKIQAEITDHSKLQSAAGKSDETWAAAMQNYISTLEKSNASTEVIDKAKASLEQYKKNAAEAAAESTRLSGEIKNLEQQRDEEAHAQMVESALAKEASADMKHASDAVAHHTSILEGMSDVVNAATAAQTRLKNAQAEVARLATVKPSDQAEAEYKEAVAKADRELADARTAAEKATESEKTAFEEYNAALEKGGGVSIARLREMRNQLKYLKENVEDNEAIERYAKLLVDIDKRIAELDAAPLRSVTDVLASSKNLLASTDSGFAANKQAEVNAAEQAHEEALTKQAQERIALEQAETDYVNKSVELEKERTAEIERQNKHTADRSSVLKQYQDAQKALADADKQSYIEEQKAAIVSAEQARADAENKHKELEEQYKANEAKRQELGYMNDAQEAQQKNQAILAQVVEDQKRHASDVLNEQFKANDAQREFNQLLHQEELYREMLAKRAEEQVQQLQKELELTADTDTKKRDRINRQISRITETKMPEYSFGNDAEDYLWGEGRAIQKQKQEEIDEWNKQKQEIIAKRAKLLGETKKSVEKAGASVFTEEQQKQIDRYFALVEQEKSIKKVSSAEYKKVKNNTDEESLKIIEQYKAQAEPLKEVFAEQTAIYNALKEQGIEISKNKEKFEEQYKAAAEAGNKADDAEAKNAEKVSKNNADKLKKLDEQEKRLDEKIAKAQAVIDKRSEAQAYATSVKNLNQIQGRKEELQAIIDNAPKASAAYIEYTEAEKLAAEARAVYAKNASDANKLALEEAETTLREKENALLTAHATEEQKNAIVQNNEAISQALEKDKEWADKSADIQAQMSQETAEIEKQTSAIKTNEENIASAEKAMQNLAQARTQMRQAEIVLAQWDAEHKDNPTLTNEDYERRRQQLAEELEIHRQNYDAAQKEVEITQQALRVASEKGSASLQQLKEAYEETKKLYAASTDSGDRQQLGETMADLKAAIDKMSIEPVRKLNDVLADIGNAKSIQQIKTLKKELEGVYARLENPAERQAAKTAMDDMSKTLEEMTSQSMTEDQVMQEYQYSLKLLNDGLNVNASELAKQIEVMKRASKSKEIDLALQNEIVATTAKMEQAMKSSGKTYMSLAEAEAVFNKGLEASSDEIKSAIEGIQHALGKEQVRNIAEINDKLKTLQERLKGNGYDKSFVDRVYGNIKSEPIEKLERALQMLRFEMERVERGGEKNAREFVEMQRKAQELQREIDGAKGSMKGMNEELKNQGDWFSTNAKKLMNYLGVFGGFYAVRQMFQRFFNESMKYDDQLTDIRKTTDLSAESIKTLADGLKHIDTRTAVENLNSLAYSAGKLGVKSVADLMGFVRAADMLNVSLGEQLGTDATEKLMKIANIMGTTDIYGLEDALTRTGSAITYLAKNSAASGEPIVAFMSRTAGLSRQAGVTTSQLAGLAAAVSALNQPVEMSATSFSKMMVQMEKSYKTVGAALKMTDAEMETLRLNLETGRSMEAFLDMLRRVKEMGGLSQTAQLAKDLGSEGSRVIQTLTTLSANYETIAHMVNQSTDAFEKNITVQDEYKKKNENTAALYERLKNSFAKMFISPEANDWLRGILTELQVLPEALQQLIDNFSGLGKIIGDFVLGHIVGLVNALSALFKIMAVRSILLNFRTWVIKTGTAFSAMGSILSKKTTPELIRFRQQMALAGNGLAGFTKRATIFFNFMKAASIGNVLTGMIAGVTMLIQLFYNNTKKIKDWSDTVESAVERVKKANAETSRMMEDSLKQLGDDNLPETTRLDLIRQLQETYKNYLGNLNLEAQSYENLARAVRAANEQLQAKQIMDATMAQVQEMRSSSAETQVPQYAKMIELIKERLTEGTDVEKEQKAISIVNSLIKNENTEGVLDQNKKGEYTTNKVLVGELGEVESRIQAKVNEQIEAFVGSAFEAVDQQNRTNEYVSKNLQMQESRRSEENRDWMNSFQEAWVGYANAQKELNRNVSAAELYGKAQAAQLVERPMEEMQSRMLEREKVFIDYVTRQGQFDIEGVRKKRTSKDSQDSTEDDWARDKRTILENNDVRNKVIEAETAWLLDARQFLKDMEILNGESEDTEEIIAMRNRISNVQQHKDILTIGTVEQGLSKADAANEMKAAREAYKSIQDLIRAFYEAQKTGIEDAFKQGKITEFAQKQLLRENDSNMNDSLQSSMGRILGHTTLEEWNKAVETLASRNQVGDVVENILQNIYHVGDVRSIGEAFASNMTRFIAANVKSEVDASKVTTEDGTEVSVVEPEKKSVEVTKGVMKKADAITHAIDYFVEKLGISVDQAAGIIGVLYEESKLNPQAVNKAERDGTAKDRGIKHLPTGYGAGLAQWTNPSPADHRKTDILKHLQEATGRKLNAIEDYSLDEQLEAIAWELMIKRPQTLALLQQQKDTTAATDIMLRGYENGGNGRLASPKFIDNYTWAGGYKGSMFGYKGQTGRAVVAAQAKALYEGKDTGSMFAGDISTTKELSTEAAQEVQEYNALLAEWELAYRRYGENIANNAAEQLSDVYKTMLERNPMGKITDEFLNRFQQLGIMFTKLNADGVKDLREKSNAVMAVYLEIGKTVSKFDVTSAEGLEAFRSYVGEMPIIGEEAAKTTDEKLRSLYYETFQYAESYSEQITRLIEKQKKIWDKMYAQTREHLASQARQFDLKHLINGQVDELAKTVGSGLRGQFGSGLEGRLNMAQIKLNDALSMSDGDGRKDKAVDKARAEIEKLTDKIKTKREELEDLMVDLNIANQEKQANIDLGVTDRKLDKEINKLETKISNLRKQLYGDPLYVPLQFGTKQLQNYGGSSRLTRMQEIDLNQEKLQDVTGNWLSDIKKAQNQVQARQQDYDNILNKEGESEDAKREAYNALDQAKQQLEFISQMPDTVKEATDALTESMMSLREETLGWVSDMEKAFETFMEGFVPFRSWYEDNGSLAENIFGTKDERQEAFGAFMDDVKKTVRKSIQEYVRLRVQKNVQDKMETASKKLEEKAQTLFHKKNRTEELAFDQSANAVEVAADNAKHAAENANSDAGTAKALDNKTKETTGSVLGNMAMAVSKAFADLGPIAGAVAAGVVSAAIGAVLTMAMNALGSGRKKPETATKTKLVTGMLTYDAGNVQSFPVMGDDGRVYNVSHAQDSLPTGMVTKPTLTTINGAPALVGERGPEMVIGRETTRAMQMYAPELLQQISLFDRHRSNGKIKTYDEGNAGAFGNAQDGQTPTDRAMTNEELRQMMMGMQLALAQSNEVNAQLVAQLQRGIRASINKYGAGGLVDEVASGFVESKQLKNNKNIARLFGG